MNRYPGVQPFATNQEHIFFGRDEDIENLYDLILLEPLVLLFGKSGYGKSSLLNAGILPKLQQLEKGDPDYFIPLVIRFGAYVEGQNDTTPLQVIEQKLAEVQAKQSHNQYLDTLNIEPSLWTTFKAQQDQDHSRFLLVFDQFEELFSYPIEQQKAFKTQLAELIYARVPQKVRDAAIDLSTEDNQRLRDPLQVKSVFAIRSDRLSFLDQLSDALPAILQKRYELKPLRNDQATKAVVEPAALENQAFNSPPFIYTPAALELLFQQLSSKEGNNTQGVEAFILQIVCQYIEREVRLGHIQSTNDKSLIEVQPSQLPDMTNIYEAYYKRQLSALPEGQQRAAKLIVEEGLLSFNEESGEGRRLSVDGRSLLDRFKGQQVNQSILDQLVNVFLLRREPNTTGGFNYEISHDTLLKPIARSRQESRAAEEARLEAIAREEAEAKAREEQQRREEAERLQQLAEQNARTAQSRTRTAIFVATLALIAAGLAIYFFFRANSAQQEAEKAQQEAEAAQTTAENRLEEVLTANAREERRRYDDLVNRGDILRTKVPLDALYLDAACELYQKADSILIKTDSILIANQLDSLNLFEGQKALIDNKMDDCPDS